VILSLAVSAGATICHAGTTNYFVRGVVKDVRPGERQLVITHEEIPEYMDAMTMPFNVKDPAILTNVTVGENLAFRLHVTATESWIDDIKKVAGSRSAGSLPAAEIGSDSRTTTNSAATLESRNPLRDYKFTNELGQPVSLSDFRGQAIALTFIFTRCPIPEFCPRLSRNFQEAQRRLKLMDNAPTNWHLLSVTFDPARDTPEVLRAYGAAYQYDPAHWSFLTGPQDKLAELARLCDVKFDPDNGLFNHSFRTLIIDTSNRLQMVFPTSGDLSEGIVQELLKATGATNRFAKPAVAGHRGESNQ
jgi:protein SCO1/2